MAGATLATLPALTSGAHAAGSDVLRVGLIGCGGRGTGAATQALRADPSVKLVAVGDVFKDRWQACLANLRGDYTSAKKIDVKPGSCFDGFDAYEGVLGAGIDVVLLATPPGFRPLHLQAAVEAGKHIFCEKPRRGRAAGRRHTPNLSGSRRRARRTARRGRACRRAAPSRASPARRRSAGGRRRRWPGRGATLRDHGGC
jgi:hypothetical protein